MTIVEDLLKKCETTKQCNSCKEDKALFGFSKNKASLDGLQYRCRSCDKEYQHNRREANKEAS